MPYSWRSWGFVALLAWWRLPIARANPSLDFPVNAQVPPVARISQPYIFEFSASTFTSAEGPISYALSGQPAWLQLVSETRTFSGTPAADDVGPVTFDLVASDSSGATSAGITLIVVSSSDVGLGQPVLPQLAKAGPTSGPASLLLYSLQAFAFTFESNTFINTTPDTSFYAVSANNTPLPNWVQFDPASLGFSGTSPPLVSSTATPQAYGIKLVASDVAGFAEASVAFQLVVGYHILSSTDVAQSIKVTPGEAFESTSFRKSLTLDSQSVADSDLISVTSNGPEWAHLDPTTITLSGIPPQDTVSTNVTIIVLDVYGDTLALVVDLDAPSLFTGTLPDVNATTGGPFTYSINPDLLINDGVQLVADLGNTSTWLQFSPQNRTFHGMVPDNFHAGPAMISLTASEGPLIESSSFVIHIVSVHHLSSSSTPFSSSSSRTPTVSATVATGSATAQPKPGRPLMTHRNIVKIVLATVLPALLIAVIMCLILCWRRRGSNRNRRRHSASQEAIIGTDEISLAVPEVAEVPPVPSTPNRSPRHSNPSHPPQIDLSWAPDSLRISRDRLSRRLRGSQPASAGSVQEDSFMEGARSALNRPLESTRIVNTNASVSHDDVPPLREVAPNYSRKRSTRSTQSQRPQSVAKNSFKRHSTVSMVSVGLPHRLSGAGHGAGGSPPPPFNGARSSWQTTLGTMPAMESKRSTIVLNDFPSPPRATAGRDMSAALQARSPNRLARETVRLLRKDSTRSSGVQKWYSDRARDTLEGRARFSSASSRPSSSSRVLWEDMGGRTISAAPPTDSEDSRRNTQQSVPPFSRGGRTESSQRLRGGSSYVRTPSKLRRDVSTVSSGQFDSNLSTDSWEDENLIEEEDENGVRLWHRGEARDTPSPRLPFEPAPESPLRLADNRNVADRQTKRSEQSEQGDLAFV